MGKIGGSENLGRVLANFKLKGKGKMKITKEQRAEILPFLQAAVQAKIDQWENEGAIEGVLGLTLDGMNCALDPFAVNCDSGADVKLEDVDSYLSQCNEE